jgi:hypothetical protein
MSGFQGPFEPEAAQQKAAREKHVFIFRAGVVTESRMPVSKPLVASSKPRTRAKVAPFNPYTFYFVMGNPPGGIPDFGAFFLSEAKRGSGEPKGGGIIFTDLSNPDKTIGFTTTKLTPKQFAFISASEGGISFRFEGRFLQSGDLRRFKDNPRRVATLEGRLRRYVRGRQRASAKVRFYCQFDVS